MSLFNNIILTGFLLFYAINVISKVFERLYYISCDVDAKQKEEDDKNNIPDSVKRLYN